MSLPVCGRPNVPGQDLSIEGGRFPSFESSANTTNSAQRSAVMTELADNIVFRVLKQELPAVQVQDPKQLNLTIEEAAHLTAHTDGGLGLAVSLRTRIQWAYGVEGPTAKLVAQKAAHELSAAVGSVSRRAWYVDSEKRRLRTALLTAFTEIDIVGNTPDQLLEYVQHCWGKYREFPDDVVPSGAVVQSSGFGKSRLLYGLAQKTCQNEELGMRVLYTCNRLTKSSGYPVTTEALRDWVWKFHWSWCHWNSNRVVSNLTTLYHYADKNWATVGYEWLELFTNEYADKSVTKKLELMATKTTSESAEESTTVHQGGRRIVVLALDSASGLLQRKIDGVDCTCFLRKAIAQANKAIRETNPEGGIFAIFTDRDSDVAGLPRFYPYGQQRPTPTNLFPPFVLTHNQDAYWRRFCAELGYDGDEVAAYKFVVTADSKELSLRSLLSMGRPLWGNALRGMECAVYMAARKLLVGNQPTYSQAYSEDSRHGVAAALCRLGLQLRPWPWSAIFVTQLMAFLSLAKSALINYPSDPILALGATQVWYSLGYSDSDPRDTLSTYILPKLSRLLTLELEVTHPGEVVGRLLLLLTMDTSILIESEKSEHEECKFWGQFVSVSVFLKALGGLEPPVMVADTTTLADPVTIESFRAWQGKWKDWKCGFCQFVEMNEAPNEDFLWVLLGRRAAAVLPGENGGADLLVPMFHGDKVAFILVQVEGVKKRAKTFPASVTEEMRPSQVFAEGNPLSQKAPGDVIRVYMNLGEPSQSSSDRYFLCDAEDAAATEEKAFSLCILSLSPRSLELEETSYPIVTKSVAKILAEMMKTRLAGDIPSSAVTAPDLTQGIIGLPTLTHEALLEEISRVRPEEATQTSD